MAKLREVYERRHPARRLRTPRADATEAEMSRAAVLDALVREDEDDAP